jgi:DNA-binding HxlR family transcriptional regulator
MRHDELGEVNCSAARSWSVIGERWTMMILRECFRGVRHYDRFRAKLGVGTTVLTDRLQVLVDEGVLARVRYQDQPPRFEYRLTAKGEDLFPVLVALMNWGDKYQNEAPPVRLVHRECGCTADPTPTCRHCGGEITWRGVRAEYAPDAW